LTEQEVKNMHHASSDNNRWVEEVLKDRDIALIGFADLSELDPGTRFGYRYGICIAIALRVLPGTTSEPSREYYDEYRDVSARLREASVFLAEKIKERGYDAYSLAHVKSNEEYRTRLPFKTLATRAGLGWIGKSACLVTKEYGNAIRLNGVLTNMPLVAGTPINGSFCGKCEECVMHCPGHAIKGNTWTLGMDRINLLDAFRCQGAIVERGKVFNVTEGTCGVCISVCPWTKRYVSRKEAGCP
jgi:epoxyqueuosine reductase QueG